MKKLINKERESLEVLVGFQKHCESDSLTRAITEQVLVIEMLEAVEKI